MDRYWETKSLAEMSKEEWESLCDGCGRCCLIRLEDEETGATAETNIACHLLDIASCRCGDYENRSKVVPDCVTLNKDNVLQLPWIPSSCAYRRLAEGRPLADWHPLIAGNRDKMIEEGVCVSTYAVSEEEVDEDELVAHITAIEEAQ